jgi:hypothetical protein
MLGGAIRDHVTGHRCPFVWFFGCEQDLSHELRDALDAHRGCVEGGDIFVVGSPR